jgi:hypothetical protein
MHAPIHAMVYSDSGLTKIHLFDLVYKTIGRWWANLSL